MEEESNNRPDIKPDFAKQLVTDLYGETVLEVSELRSYQDRNFHILAISSNSDRESCSLLSRDVEVAGNGGGKEYVLKVVACPDDDKNEGNQLQRLEIQSMVLEKLRMQGFVCPQFQRNVAEEYYTILETSTKPDHNGSKKQKRCIVFMYDYIQGERLYGRQPLTGNVLYDMGRLLADLRSTFKGMPVEVKSLKPTFWSLEAFPNIRRYLNATKDVSKILLVEDIVQRYDTKVKAVWSELPKSLIHGDFHDGNILHLNPGVLQSTDKPRDYTKPSTGSIITNPRLSYGLIDFMDISYSASVCDLAVALAFAMIGVGDNCSSADHDDFILSSGHLLAGYVLRYPLNQSEMSALFTLVCSTYCMELVIGQHEYDNQEETNLYLLTSLKDGWRQLTRLMQIGEKEIQKRWENIVSQYEP